MNSIILNNVVFLDRMNLIIYRHADSRVSTVVEDENNQLYYLDMVGTMAKNNLLHRTSNTSKLCVSGVITGVEDNVIYVDCDRFEGWEEDE